MARIRIGDLMVRAGLIDDMQLQAALAFQRQWGGRLGDVLVTQGFLDEMMLWKGLSKQLAVPLVSLPEMRIPPDVVGLIPLETAERLEMFPVGRDERTLTVATSEPNNIGALDEIAFRSGLKVKTVLAPAREIEWAIRTYYRGARDSCPPPRVRRTSEAPESTQPPRAALMEELPTAPPPPPVPSLGQTQTPLQQLSPTGTPRPMQPWPAPRSGLSLPPGVVDEQQHRQTVETLRAVIELCIARGVFTREELWQMLQKKP